MTKTALDSKQRFSSRVDAYVAARPRYPREIIPHLQKEIGLTPAWTLADLGSGTGISAELFLQNGNSVSGVEPNAPMRAAAEKSLRGFAKFKSINASAEHTTLPDHSIDLTLAAQAFHWFDIDATRKECRRILNPTGWALLMWNDRLLRGSPFLEAYEKFLLAFGTDYEKVRHNNTGPDKLAGFFGSKNYRTAAFPNAQHLDYPGLRSRVLSSSYTPPPDHPNHAPMLADLQRLFDTHQQNNHIDILYKTELFYGQPQKD